MEQDPVVFVSPPRLLPVFCLWKTLVKKISLTREVTNVETKENNQSRLNNNNAVLKHGQGLLVFFKSYRWYSEPHPVSCLINSKNQVEKLTAGWPGCTHNLSCHYPCQNWLQGNWNWRLTAHETTKMMLVWPLMTSLSITVKDDYADSTCHPLTPLCL